MLCHLGIFQFGPLEIGINFLLKDKLTLFQAVFRWKVIEPVIEMEQFRDTIVCFLGDGSIGDFRMQIELQIERLVWNLAIVNRPKDPEEFQKGNFGFASTLLETLKRHGNKAPVMLSSSIQATLAGRFGKSEYGLSKKAGEELFFDYAA